MKNCLLTFATVAIALIFQAPFGILSASAQNAATDNQARKIVQTNSIIEAVSEGNIKTIKKILKNKGNVNATDAAGNTALMVAAAHGNDEIIQLLIQNHAELNTKNKEAQTALYISLVNEQTKVALSLIEQGSQLENINGEGDSALQTATTVNSNEVMKLLIKKNSKLVNLPNKNGSTPLLEAARFGTTETVRILLQAGADLNVKNAKGKSALDIAIKAQNESAIRLLQK